MLSACASSPSDAPTASPQYCGDLSGCPSYQVCCSNDEISGKQTCHYLDPSGNTIGQLPSQCSSSPPAPEAGTDAPGTDAAFEPNWFVGTWLPVSGGGQESCSDGSGSSLTPNPSAMLTITQTGPNSLEFDGPSGCPIPLTFAGATASVNPPGYSCSATSPYGSGQLTVASFTLTYDYAYVGDAGSGDAGTDAASEASTDAGLAGLDGSTSMRPPALDWKVNDSALVGNVTCTSIFDYVLVP